MDVSLIYDRCHLAEAHLNEIAESGEPTAENLENLRNALRATIEAVQVVAEKISSLDYQSSRY